MKTGQRSPITIGVVGVLTMSLVVACGSGLPVTEATLTAATLPTEPMATVTPSPTMPPDAVVTVLSLNVRSGPGTDYDPVGFVFQSDSLVVIGQANDCTWLNVITPEEIEGWVSAHFVELRLDCAQIEMRASSRPSAPAVAFTEVPTLAPQVTSTPTAPPATLSPTTTATTPSENAATPVPTLVPQDTFTLIPTPTVVDLPVTAPDVEDTATPLPTLVPQDTPTATATGTVPPTATDLLPTETVESTNTPSREDIATSVPTPVPQDTPTDTPQAETMTPTSLPTVTDTPTTAPTAEPEPTVMVTPTATWPPATETLEPTAFPPLEPSPSPTDTPTPA